MKTYTQFDKSTLRVVGRLVLQDEATLPDDYYYVEGFFPAESVYDPHLGKPLSEEVPMPVTSRKVEGRAFGDNVSFNMLPPYWVVHVWRRLE